MQKQQIFEMLQTLLEVPSEQRRETLDELCGDDEPLRRRLEELLALETEADEYLAQPVIEGATTIESEELEAGSRLGPYRIVDRVGRGGMGVVYRATRERDFEKAVAIKIIRHGLPRSLITRRFHTERQILARLEHPGIARLLDGGTTAGGDPYLVMELIEGEPLLDFCDARGLGLRQRLELFLQALDAVAYAHRRLVVHRDLKPDNILVSRDETTGESTVKLLDFGIAKLLDIGDGPGSDPTLPAERPMTLLFASPEQVRREPITPASDIYSLGVVLHHLLTGRSPYRVARDSWSEIVRAVCESEPRRPSSTLAAGPRRRQLSGDVDAILLEALHKQPRLRYASVERFADDIRRHLDHRPVRARRSTWTYRLGKRVRRQPLATTAVLLLLGFSITSTMLWRRAEHQRNEAVREQNRAERISTLLIDLFESTDPDVARGATLPAQTIVDRARARLSANPGDPELEAEMTATLARLYRDLGLRDQAIELLERCVDLRRQLHPEGHPTLDAARAELAQVRRGSAAPESEGLTPRPPRIAP